MLIYGINGSNLKFNFKYFDIWSYGFTTSYIEQFKSSYMLKTNPFFSYQRSAFEFS